MSEYVSIADIRETVESQGGLAAVTLQDLREALGYAKLGPRVLDTIAAELEGHGLGYFPEYLLDDNPAPRRHEEVRVYLKNTPLGEVVSAVIRPSGRGDERLLEVANDNNAQMITEIRKILE